MAEAEKVSVEDSIFDPKWARTRSGRFFNLVHMDPEAAGLSGVSAIYVIWHSGLRPRWLVVGKTADLAATCHQLKGNEDVLQFEVNGGIFMTWSLIRDEYQDGVLKFLYNAMKPMVPLDSPPGGEVAPIPVWAPGAEPKVVEEPGPAESTG